MQLFACTSRRCVKGCLTGRYTPLSLISVSRCKRPIHSMRPRARNAAAHAEEISPLNLYSAGSLTCRGFAPETVVSLKPFSAAFRWLPSTSATSGAPARRKGLRIGIAVGNLKVVRGGCDQEWSAAKAGVGWCRVGRQRLDLGSGEIMTLIAEMLQWGRNGWPGPADDSSALAFPGSLREQNLSTRRRHSERRRIAARTQTKGSTLRFRHKRFKEKC